MSLNLHRRDALVALAGDMWNELENLRDLWTGTDREAQCVALIEEYEAITDLAREQTQ